MRILISGGGIAGLTLAYWLHRYGFQPVVIEQAEGIRRDGYGIDFFGTGYDVAERMGIIEQLQKRPLPITQIVMIEKTGKAIARLDLELMHKIMGGKYIGLMHWTLEDVLYTAIEKNVEVRFGTSLKAVQQSPDAVTVTFQDGLSEQFDLLIGADGIHSRTRALMFGPEEQFSRYLGYTIACYPLQDRYGLRSVWTNYAEPGRVVGAYGSGNADEIITLFMYKSAKPERIPREQRLARLKQEFGQAGWLAQSFVNDVPESTNIFMDSVTQIRMPTWYRGRIALVGDACGCPTLASGQGASLAMGGAYILAEALHEMVDYQKAFVSYEQEMLPHVTRQQEEARSLAKYFAPRNWLDLQLQRVVLKIVMRDTFAGVLRRQFGAESLLKHRVKAP